MSSRKSPIKIRRKWTRNPAEQVVESKRQKTSGRLTTNEVDEILADEIIDAEDDFECGKS